MTADTYEDTLAISIGQFGRYHLYLMLILMIPIKITGICSLMSIIVLAPRTGFRCEQIANSTAHTVLENSTCYSDCVKYVYYSDFDRTIISEWGLICEEQWLANFTQTLCMFGVMVGSIAFGFVADRYGRKSALLIACMLQLVAGLAIAFSPDYWVFAALRFLIGAAVAGTMLVSYIIALEVTGPRWRELMSCLVIFPTCIGELLMPFIGYFLRSWDQFSLGIAAPCVIYLSYFFIVPESPKWLVSMGKLEKASYIMTTAAKWNGLPSANMLDVAKTMANEATMSGSKKAKASYWDLVRIPSYRWKNFCSCLIWFIEGMSYYGCFQYLGQTSSNVYVTVTLAVAVQLPGLLLASVCCRVFGRRKTIMSFSLVAATSTAVLAVPDDWFYLRLVFGSIGLTASMSVFTFIYMYTTELFPTVARNMALSSSSTASRVGSMIAPFVAGLGVTAAWAPPLFFAAAPLVITAATYYLPETKGKKLEDLMEDS